MSFLMKQNSTIIYTNFHPFISLFHLLICSYFIRLLIHCWIYSDLPWSMLFSLLLFFSYLWIYPLFFVSMYDCFLHKYPSSSSCIFILLHVFPSLFHAFSNGIIYITDSPLLQLLFTYFFTIVFCILLYDLFPSLLKLFSLLLYGPLYICSYLYLLSMSLLFLLIP